MNKIEFIKAFNLTEAQFIGAEKINKGLELGGLTLIPEGFNPTVDGYLHLNGLTSIPEGFNPTVGGSLNLNRLTSIPEGFNPTVGCNFNLGALTSIPEGFNPKVGRNLDLDALTSIPDEFNPTVGGDLYLSGLTSIPEGFNPKLGGDLYLGGLNSIPDGFNPTVGGSLYLNGLTSIPEGFNPMVGDSLHLNGLTSIPDGFNPTVCGNLYLTSLTSIPKKFNPTVGGDLSIKNRIKRIGSQVPEVVINRNFFWSRGDMRFAKIDGIFCEILHETEKVVGGRTYRLFSAKKVASDDVFFIANFEDFYAHGSDLRSAFSDLEFKITSERLKKEPISADTMLTVSHYRAITGACNLGCRDWMDKNGIPYKIVDGNVVEESPIKAADLFPLLKKSDAWGFEKFKKLVKF